MAGCMDRRRSALCGVFACAILGLPAGVPAQEPEQPSPAEQIEDVQLRGLHAQMLGLHEQMQELRARMAERRQQLLGEDAAQTPPHDGRHAMHLRGLGGGRDMGMGMQSMKGRGMMMGRTMSGQEMTGQEMTDEGMAGHGMMGRGGASEGTDPQWCPTGMGRGMCRRMTGEGAASEGEPGGSGTGG